MPLQDIFPSVATFAIATLEGFFIRVGLYVSCVLQFTIGVVTTLVADMFKLACQLQAVTVINHAVFPQFLTLLKCSKAVFTYV